MSGRLKRTFYLIVGLLLVGNILTSLTYVQDISISLWSGDALVHFLTFLFAGAYVLEFIWDMKDYRPDNGFLAQKNVRDASSYIGLIVAVFFLSIGSRQVFHPDLMGYLEWSMDWGIIVLLVMTGYHILRDLSATSDALTDGSQDNPFHWILSVGMGLIFWGKDRVDEFLGKPSNLSGAHPSDQEEPVNRVMKLFGEEGFLPTLEDGKDIRVVFGGILRVLGGLIIVSGVLLGLVLVTYAPDHAYSQLSRNYLIDPFFGVGLGLIQVLLLAYAVGLLGYALGKTFLIRGDRLFGIQASRFDVLPTIGEVVTYGVEYLKLIGECLFLSGIGALFIAGLWTGFELIYALLHFIFYVHIETFLPSGELFLRGLNVRLLSVWTYEGHFWNGIYALLAGVGALTVGFLFRISHYVIAEFTQGFMNVTDSVWAFLIRMEWGRWITTGEDQ